MQSRYPHLVGSLVLLLAAISCKSLEAPPDDGKRWGEPIRLDEGEAAVFRPELVFDEMGNAIVIWHQADLDELGGAGVFSNDVWSCTLAPGAADWQGPVRLDDNEPCDSFPSQIAPGGDGSSVVVYVQDEGLTPTDCGTRYSVWTTRRTPEAEWVGSQCIHPECGFTTGVAARPDVVVGRDGSAVAVWQQAEETSAESFAIWSNRFTPQSGWEQATPVERNAGFSEAPAVALVESSTPLVVYARFDGNRSGIFSKRQLPTGEWSDLQAVSSFDAGNAFDPQLASVAGGAAIAVWTQGGAVWSARYVVSEASQRWEELQRIDAEAVGESGRPDIAMDPSGNAIVVWARTGEDFTNVWSNRYVVGVGWETAERIVPGSLSSGRDPRVALDAQGNAVAVWVQFDGIQDSIWSSRYLVNSGWGRSAPIELDDEARASGPRIAVDDAGKAVVVWTMQGDEDDPNQRADLWSNRLE
jgi:hypothetical protein